MKLVAAIEKILSRNDVGETDAHQSGILVPKKGEILSFFPLLDKRKLNPRTTLTFYDDSGHPWEFVFIYYNNKPYYKNNPPGSGTRDEYHLTCMTAFMRKYGLAAGDSLVFRKYDNGRLEIGKGPLVKAEVEAPEPEELEEVLVLSSKWKFVKIR